MRRFLAPLTDLALIVLGIFSAALGLKGFLLSSRLIDGGVTGISMLVAAVSGWPLAILLLVINLPFVILGYRHIGRRFAVKGMLAISGLALTLALVKFPAVTPDKLLTAVFGGFFLGAGIGLAIRGGAVLDGTEVAALLISKSTAFLRVGDVILILNIFIFTAAAFLLGIETAMYSILTYFAASRTIDFIIHGIEEYTAITIISERSEVIRHEIIRSLGRGVTVLKAKRGLTDADQDVLYCVVTRLEIWKIKRLTREIDPKAFVLIHPLADAEGGVIKPAGRL